ncbi:MAG: flagellar FlbD family protein [Dehalobacterium sp.]
MIKITTLDQRKIALNPDLIERVEMIPETVLTLTNGKKILVQETMPEIIEKFIAYKRQIAWYPQPAADDETISECV